MTNEEVKETKETKENKKAAIPETNWEELAKNMQLQLNRAYDEISTLRIILNEFIENKKKGER